jgi:hypothetical protein
VAGPPAAAPVPNPPTPPQKAIDALSLRDYFAGQALVGLATTFCRRRPGANRGKDMAVDAYRLADAMMAARELK